MYVIIGGEERCIDQVDSFAEYRGGDCGEMSACEIFYGARADRLFSKILQLKIDEAAKDLASGKAVELPVVEHRDINSFSGGNNTEKARNAEYYYAEQANKILTRG